MFSYLKHRSRSGRWTIIEYRSGDVEQAAGMWAEVSESAPGPVCTTSS